MRLIVGIAFLMTFLQGNSQTSKFREEAATIVKNKDSTVEIVLTSASTEPYDFLSRGSEDLKLLCLSELKDISRNKPDELRNSITLEQLAALATKYWRGSHYSDSKKWNKLHKYFRRASDKVRAGFNIMKEVSFRIPLVDGEGREFYYDSKGEGGLNLYQGKKPRTKQEREENEAIPLKFFTEEQLVKMFVKRIKKKRLYNDLKSGNISCVGLSIEIDEKTLYRTKIPTARVVLVIGARRLKNIPARYQQQNDAS